MDRPSPSTARPAFFQRFGQVDLSLGDVVPQEGPAVSSERTPYAGYLMGLEPSPFDDAAGEMRVRALNGGLMEADFQELNGLLEEAKAGRNQAQDLFRHYAAVKALAMQAAQVLFVHHCVVEGLPQLVGHYEKRVEDVAELMAQRGSGRSNLLNPRTRRFFASLILLQTAFDRIFVPPEPIGRYRYQSGEFRLSPGYRDATEYLDFCAIFEVEASPAERELCENITTGWGDGIGRPEWDRLNSLYYQGLWAHSGKANLFATHYNHLLERMLPQFAYSKVRLAETVVADLEASRPVRVLEFGAGSGAFAIDLLMALKRRGLPQDQVEYLGLEPSTSMIEGFAENTLSKLGHGADLGQFGLRQGSLEEAQEQIEELSASPARETVGVFSYSPHHIHHSSLKAFLRDAEVRRRLSRIYFLEGTERHGWTKMLYMWSDCESPENFRNVTESGDWQSRFLWEEPSVAIPEYPHVTNAWCRARLLTP
ncbi:MAG TPA: class I SAM-dependent methyltransferase [Acidobacteriota bacterium]|nr:class I SAM-dependent methyltransferase [Acidobacteriota bacterium]